MNRTSDQNLLALSSAFENQATQILSTRAVAVLRNLILVIGISIVVLATYLLFTTQSVRFVGGASLAYTCVLACCYFELKAGRTTRGIAILFWGIWSIAFCVSFVVAGIRTPALVAVPATIMIVAWLQGRRASLLMVVATIAGLAILVVADALNWLPPTIQRTPLHVFMVYSATIAFVTVLSIVIAEHFQRLLRSGRGLTQELRTRMLELQASERTLQELTDQLEDRVKRRTAQLTTANQSLNDTVEALKRTQAELVQAEKLASLGSMVAGISHELNTPIGSTLTTATSLEDLFQRLDAQLALGNLKRSALADFVAQGQDMAQFLTRSTTKALNLVGSFKQLALDQTSAQRRSFDLREVIEANLDAFKAELAERGANLEITVADNVSCDSYPGPLGQIIHSVVQNALTHGFKDRDGGRLRINADVQAGQISLHIENDGEAITPHVLAHIFDPFFTTQLGKGSSGLGLSVSHRLATSVLGGNLDARSSVPEGTCMTLTFPQRAPHAM